MVKKLILLIVVLVPEAFCCCKSSVNIGVVDRKKRGSIAGAGRLHRESLGLDVGRIRRYYDSRTVTLKNSTINTLFVYKCETIRGEKREYLGEVKKEVVRISPCDTAKILFPEERSITYEICLAGCTHEINCSFMGKEVDIDRDWLKSTAVW